MALKRLALPLFGFVQVESEEAIGLRANHRKAVSLYRNWRPRSFADLVGQDVVVRTLSHALESNRLVHAYLFSGPRGSGKTSAAKIFARCITCEHGPTPTPDNTCQFCTSILDGSALDVVEIDAASNRGIDEIRALRDAVKFAPSAMRKKVYIIDEAHMLTKEGANAFLKTLEEPPSHVVFILATTAPESLPVTILSRCQRFAFRRISTAVMVERMRHIAIAEQIQVDDNALTAIAYRADGGLRDALTMLEQASAFSQGVIDADAIEDAFGASGRLFAGQLLDAYIAGDAVSVLRIIEAASDAGTEMSNLIRSLIAELRHVVVSRIDRGLLEGELVAADVSHACARAEQLSQARALRALRLLTEALAQARVSGNPRLELESALLRLTLQAEDPSLEALSIRVRQLEEQLLTAGASPPSPATTKQPTHAPGTNAKIQQPAIKKASIESIAAAQPAATPSSDAQTKVASTRPVQALPVLEVASPNFEPTQERQHDASQNEESPVEAPTLQRVRSLWQSVCGRAEAQMPSLRGPLSRAQVESVDGWTITLVIPDQHNAGILTSRLVPLEAALAEVLRGGCKVSLKVLGGTLPRKAKKPVEDPGASHLGLLDYAAQRLGTIGDDTPC